MKRVAILIVGMSIGMASMLRADVLDTSGSNPALESADLKRDEKSLKQMQANRRLDNEHTGQAQKEFRNGTAELSGDDEQQLRNVRELRSVQTRVADGQIQENAAHQSYKATVQKYGSDDPRSAAAKESWQQSRLALDPLFESLSTINKDLYRGRLLVHNDKVTLSIQKRSMYSDSLYRASDDRHIKKMEKNIADDRKAMPQNILLAEPQ